MSLITSRRPTLFCAALLGALLALAPWAGARSRSDAPRLAEFSQQSRARVIAKQTPLYHRLRASTNPANPMAEQLMFIGRRGMPVYYHTTNLNAAKSVRTWDVWPVGVGGGFFGVTGATTNPGELAVWDQGKVFATHVEFGGRVTQMDGATKYSQHSTHVSGTLVAGGINTDARGMSYQAPLHAYDWRFDTSEMAAAAAGNLEISSHSYGHVTGWESNRWYGDITVAVGEDYGFGFYDEGAQEFDQVARLAPEYLIVIGAGNDRNDGWFGTHYHWDPGLEEWVSANDVHGTDYQSGGYDTVNWFGTAKNALLVGAVDDIPGGYAGPGSVLMMPFSNWGPCDDGRIKPDIVANGFALVSTDTLPGAYHTSTGTSMAAPSVAGSVNLIAHEYTSRFSQRPLSSTLKAVVINTADEAGSSDGPDYAFGWGLLNTYRAIDLVRALPSDDQGVTEATLDQGETDTYSFSVSAPQPVRITIAWTDLAGTPPPASVDPANKMLVNDVDVRITRHGGGTTMPWTLNRLNPAAAPVQADNTVDNVEQIDIALAAAGEYDVTVTHKGTLAGGPQDYSLVWRGAHASGPTAVGPASTPALRIGLPVPNPVRTRATIGYHLEQSEPVSIRVYDVNGRRVATLAENQVRAAGRRQRGNGRGIASVRNLLSQDGNPHRHRGPENHYSQVAVERKKGPAFARRAFRFRDQRAWKRYAAAAAAAVALARGTPSFSIRSATCRTKLAALPMTSSRLGTR